MKPETLSNIFHAFNKTEYEKEGDPEGYAANRKPTSVALLITPKINRFQ